MPKKIALGLVAGLSILSPLLLALFPSFMADHARSWATICAIGGLWVLAAIRDGRMIPSFARLGERAFAGRGAGLWLSLLFVIVLTGLTIAWGERLKGVELLSWAALSGLLVHYLVFMAPWEEIWWRGVWFAAGPPHYWMQVLAGSALFTLLHLPRADWTLAVVFVMGVAFASLKRAGAPLVLLIVLHGLNNVLNRMTVLAVDADAMLVTGTTAILIGAALIAIVAGFWRAPTTGAA